MKTLKGYYIEIKLVLDRGDYTIKQLNKIDCPKSINTHLEAIHFIMYSYMKKKKDKRLKDILDYVCIPKKLMKLEFTEWETEELLKGMVLLKD